MFFGKVKMFRHSSVPNEWRLDPKGQYTSSSNSVKMFMLREFNTVRMMSEKIKISVHHICNSKQSFTMLPLLIEFWL